MKNLILYIHGKGGSAEEARRYEQLFPDCEVFGFDYSSEFPWNAVEEFRTAINALKSRFSHITLIANSIGAYFSMLSFSFDDINRAFFISPIVDMEKLILDMMQWAGVTEKELSEKKEIPTSFGAILSWGYLSWVRAHPLEWNVPTDILYGSLDNLQSIDTVSSFSKKCGASLTVMDGGEHWFHTDEQMSFLDVWIKSKQ